jgi:uncharacterized protein (DUF433 family)
VARGKRGKTQGHRQFSLRVAASVFEGLERRTAELAASRNALAERYIAEGVKMDEHPDICFREGELGRRAALTGTRLDVWQVMDTVRNSGNSVEEAAQYLGLPEGKVRGAVRYYAAYRDEVDEFAARATAIAERGEAAWRAEQEILAG